LRIKSADFGHAAISSVTTRRVAGRSRSRRGGDFRTKHQVTAVEHRFTRCGKASRWRSERPLPPSAVVRPAISIIRRTRVRQRGLVGGRSGANGFGHKAHLWHRSTSNSVKGSRSSSPADEGRPPTACSRLARRGAVAAPRRFESADTRSVLHRQKHPRPRPRTYHVDDGRYDHNRRAVKRRRRAAGEDIRSISVLRRMTDIIVIRQAKCLSCIPPKETSPARCQCVIAHCGVQPFRR